MKSKSNSKLPVITPKDSLLLIIDIQERLSKILNQDYLKRVCAQIGLLAELAHEQGIPIVLTEQYPKGLGPTIEPVRKILEGKRYETLEKVAFGCCGDSTFNERLKTYRRKNIILVGMETHVCVYLTAQGLIQAGYKPFVASDAVISRETSHYKNGLELMRDIGAVVTNAETILFELMGQCATPLFKKISGLLKENLAAK